MDRYLISDSRIDRHLICLRTASSNSSFAKEMILLLIGIYFRHICDRHIFVDSERGRRIDIRNL